MLYLIYFLFSWQVDFNKATFCSGRNIYDLILSDSPTILKCTPAWPALAHFWRQTQADVAKTVLFVFSTRTWSMLAVYLIYYRLITARAKPKSWHFHGKCIASVRWPIHNKLSIPWSLSYLLLKSANVASTYSAILPLPRL